MDKNKVYIAFEILLKEIDEAINIISDEAEKHLKAKDFGKAKTLIEYGEQLKYFREKIKTLRKKWQTIFSEKPPIQDQKNKVKGNKKGGRTPEEQFIIPILESIIELGGKAEVKRVYERVHSKMKDILTEYDYEPLPSNPQEIRWKNNVRFARLRMVKEGLLAENSPRGIWEITEKGRKFYEENKQSMSLSSSFSNGDKK